MAETQQKSLSDLVNQVRERVDQELHAQAEELRKLEQGLEELRAKQSHAEETIRQQLEVLGKFEPAPAPAPVAADTPMEELLGSVRNLITATLPEQVLDVLTEDAEQLGVRAAVFDVRGKAAWGSSARGFGPGLSANTFRALIVSLTQDNPFRQCYETAGSVETSADQLKKNRNVVEKLHPTRADQIILLPIRSAGSVSAIFYADAGGKQQELPVDALKILTEFAGAQLDRLMAFSGGLPPEAEAEEAEAVPEAIEEVEVEAAEPEPAAAEVSAVAAAPQASAATVAESAPPVAEAPPPAVSQPPAVAPAGGVSVEQLSEAEQKLHRDAKRFARLLVSEIELYNKTKVADGRKNKDLYKRLKSDIDRSRHTYEKRFGKTIPKPFDYFHEEVVKTLASSDPSLLGSGYPGPSA